MAADAGGRSLAGAENDATLGEVVGGHFHLDLVADVEADEILPHFAGDVGQNFVPVGELDTEGSAFHDRQYFAFNF